MTKVKQELNKKTTSEKTEYGKRVVTKMTSNATFTAPNPTLPTVTTAINNVIMAIADVDAARVTLQTKISILDQQEAILDGLLTQLGAYVENVSNGDEAKILSTGWMFKKKEARQAYPKKLLR